MADLIADYDALKSMADLFDKATQQFEQMVKALEEMGQQIDDGALKGAAGSKLSMLLAGKLAGRVAYGIDQFNELKKDILGAMSDLSDADVAGAKQFSV
jgi:hypothetical protein